MEMPDAEAVKAGFDGFRSALDTFKRLREMFKNDPEKHKELGADLEQAEKEIQLAEAQIAQALGYKLCKAHFPPIPMLLDHVHPEYTEAIFKCPECKRESPTPEHFEKRIKRKASIQHLQKRYR